jgi:signal peptidase I
MKLKKFFKWLKVFVKLIILILVFLWLCASCQEKKLYVISGSSMEPTFHDKQIIFANTKFDNIIKNDVVVFRHQDEILVKRVRGIEGDIYIKSSQSFGYYLAGYNIELSRKKSLKYYKIEKIPHDYYFVAGDNSFESFDSAYFGLISKKDILALYN